MIIHCSTYKERSCTENKNFIIEGDSDIDMYSEKGRSHASVRTCCTAADMLYGELPSAI